MKKDKKISILLFTFIVSAVILFKNPILAFAAADFNIGNSYPDSYDTDWIHYEADTNVEIVKVGNTYSMSYFYLSQYINRSGYSIEFVAPNNSYYTSSYASNFQVTGEFYNNDSSKPMSEASFTFPTPGNGLDIYDYWKITEVWFPNGSDWIYITVEPFEYIEPTLSLTCDKTTIAAGEESTCKIKAHTNTSIYRASFKLEPIGYTITSIIEGSSFNAITSSDGVYSVERKDTAERVTSETDVEIATFKLKLESDNVEDVANNIQLKNVSFTDGAGNNTVEETVAATITKGSNPLTGTIIFKGMLILIMILSGLGIVLIIKNRKMI